MLLKIVGLKEPEVKLDRNPQDLLRDVASRLPLLDINEACDRIFSAGTFVKEEIEEMGSNWNYIIARKGGYNNLLHITIQELLELGEDGADFLRYLTQERTVEIQHRLQQLQAEYQRLQGNQLQEHFQELWKSHYILLKNKQSRTWKEEIFLAAFDAFIAWVQT